MKFGILQFFSWPGRRTELATVYQRGLERIEIMDQNGYDAVWLTEHHFNDYSVCPSIPVIGTYAAARTKHIPHRGRRVPGRFLPSPTSG